MANLDTKFLPTLKDPISNLINNVKYNPVNMQGIALDHLELLTEKKVDIIDPTNPFIFLLEASAVMASAAVNESLSHTREIYPVLASTDEEVYKHMSDVDYIGRFSSPSTAIVDIIISTEELFIKAIQPVGKDYKLITIPRNTMFTVDDNDFLLQYPVDIKAFLNISSGAPLDVYEVSYQTDVISPLQNIYTNLIEHYVVKSPDNNNWMSFSLPLKQLTLTTNEFTTSIGERFEARIEGFKDDFHHAIIYNKSVSTGNLWVPLKTTHTSTIYDVATPTVNLKVVGKNLIVSIPPAYTSTGGISGTIRVDTYTSKGRLYLPLNDINFENWSTKAVIVDSVRDTDEFVGAGNNVGYLISSKDVVDGGNDGLSFKQLREAVIYNTVGLKNTPVTIRDLIALSEELNFTINKAIDLVTERVFTASRKLPNITNNNLEVKPDITRQTLNYSKGDLSSIPGITTVDTSIIIPAGTIFKVSNDITTILTTAEVNNINALSIQGKINYFKNNEIYYNLYHYVLDDNIDGDFSSRAYDLSSPVIDRLTFVSLNTEVDYKVNTASYIITKTNNGYDLIITTISNELYQNEVTAKLKAQIRVLSSENKYVYLNSVSTVQLSNNERSFTFNIDTGLSLDKYDNLDISNGITNGSTSKINLNSDIEVFYTINDPALVSTSYPVNNSLDLSAVPGTTQALSEEVLTITLGEKLKYLWTRSNKTFNGNKYLLHTTDKLSVYKDDVYAPDPVTGRIFTVTGTPPNTTLVYNKIHSAGDPVLDSNSNQLYDWRIGDPVLDSSGSPVIDQLAGIDLQFDVVLTEAEFLYTTDAKTIEENTKYLSLIKSWLKKDMVELNRNTLELTTVEYLPVKTSGTINADIGNGVNTNINTSLSPKIKVHVSPSVSKNTGLIDTLNDLLIKVLVDNITLSTVNMNEIKTKMLDIANGSIKGISIENLIDFKDSDVLNVITYGHGLKIKKKLISDTAGILYPEYDVEIEYIVI